MTAATSFRTNAGRFLASTALTVDTAMKGYAKVVKTGQISITDQEKVHALYVQYQEDMAIATNAYALAITVADPSVFAGPSNTLFQSKSSLTTATLPKQ